ncbi:MAG: hypothetical protein J5953_13740 [Prevotella sp.]|nr:hypothetical protein [Prevotella sp.]
MTNDEIIAAGQQIYDETEVAANTSERVGGVIKGIGENLKEKDEGIENAKTEIVDNLNEETAASGKALDAHQGFVLAGQISKVQDDFNEFARHDTENQADLDIEDDMGNVLARFENGHFKTKNFNSEKVKFETDDTENQADLDITDKDGNVLVRFEGGHIKTKYFDSSDIKTSVFPHPNVMGSPQIYLPAYDNEAKTLFGTTAEVYAAYDDLVTNYPQYFGGKTSIGKDASNTYDIYKYQLGWQNRKVTNDRAGTNTNTYSDAEYKPLRLVLCSGCHPNETPSLYGCWWAVKEILESNEDWALFIKSNLIIDVVPLINPWGLDNGQVDVNYNGKNINRCYYTDQQAENLAMIGLLQDLKAIGLKGVIDCHNTGYADNDGYIVSKPSYPYWNYYVNLGQHVSALMNGLFNSFFGTVKNHFHVWDSSAYSGQLHDYVNNELGLLGVTFEVRQRLTSSGPIQSKVAQFTKVMAINFINAFTTYNE